MAGTNANTRGLGTETILLAPRTICVPRLKLLNKACIPLWECYVSMTKYSNVIKIEIVTWSLHHPPALRCLSLSIPSKLEQGLTLHLLGYHLSSPLGRLLQVTASCQLADF